MDFADTHVVVSGGTGALGTAVVHRLLEGGAVCHVPNLHGDELQNFPHRKDPRVVVTSGIDLTNEDQVKNYYDALPDLWASIHIAGGFAMAPVTETSKDDFQSQMNMNALSCFLCCSNAARILRRKNIGGRMVNVAARPALEPRTGAGMVAYTASKAAVAALTEALGEELAADGIWVNAVAPSIMDTPGNRAAMPDANHALWPGVDEVAATIVYLASPANGSARSAVVPVYGKS